MCMYMWSVCTAGSNAQARAARTSTLYHVSHTDNTHTFQDTEFSVPRDNRIAPGVTCLEALRGLRAETGRGDMGANYLIVWRYISLVSLD